MASTTTIFTAGRPCSFVLKWAQHDPDKGQRGDAQSNRSKVVGCVGKLDRFIADIVCHGATNRRDQILPQMIARLALGALQKQHDQAGKNDHGRPVVGGFHRVSLLINAAFTAVFNNVASFTFRIKKVIYFVMGGRWVSTVAERLSGRDATEGGE